MSQTDQSVLDEQLSPLSEDIHLLGDALGQVIREQHGVESFELEERVRQAAISRRAGDEGSLTVLDEVIEQAPLSERQVLIKAFSNYFQLVNIAEDQHRIRVLRQRERSGELRESVGAALQTLANDGMSGQDMRELLERVQVELVLTAHPTEAKRHEVLFKLRRIGRLVDRRDRVDLTPREQEQLRDELLQEIESLWKTAPTRALAPSVMDEVGVGLYYLTSTIQEAVTQIYRETREQLEAVYPQEDWYELPVILRYASWIGGDRDGHPEVTPEVTLRTVARMRQAGRQEVLAKLTTLRDYLTQAGEEIDEAMGGQPGMAAANGETEEFPNEPFRQWIEGLRLQLEQGAITTGQELAVKLMELGQYLRAHGGRHSARGDLWRLIQQARVFGLQLAALDLREDARRLVRTVGQWLEEVGLIEDYAGASETERQQALRLGLDQAGRFLEAPHDGEGVRAEVRALMELGRDLLGSHGPEAVRSLIGSMSSTPSDVLVMLLLATAAGMEEEYDVVPLFETVEDLQSAHETLEALFEIPAYRNHVGARGDRVQVMLGYSDSVKDGGYLASNWNLYLAQERMAEVCRRAGISLEVFHGRGGSIGRGGGPSNRAILSLPPGSIAGGRIRMTEQGEVIAYRYGRRGIAWRHLHQLLHATLLATARPTVKEPEPVWRQAMGELAGWGQEAYRDLVYETEGFFEYWRQATPYAELTELQIGSRPAQRRHGGFEAVRAIPWVFSWMQCRVLLPSWYGLGYSFERYCRERPQGEAELTAMYQDWPFFRLLMDNVELDLAKVELGIAERYASLVGDEDLRESIFSRIEEEYERTRRTILAITGRQRLLDGMPVIQRSIERRNPYVDPLNFIQVELLRELRATDPSDPRHDQLLEATLATIKGLAAAMKTTG